MKYEYSPHGSVINVPAPAAPEQCIADILQKEAHVTINPQVLRLIVKYNWRELSKAAHEIHDA